MTIQFVGGDDLIEPFRITNPDGTLVDLTGAVVTAKVLNRGAEIDLSMGSGIEVASPLPTTDGEAHGFVILRSDQTLSLPLGNLTTLRITVQGSDGLIFSTIDEPLERIA